MSGEAVEVGAGVCLIGTDAGVSGVDVGVGDGFAVVGKDVDVGVGTGVSLFGVALVSAWP